MRQITPRPEFGKPETGQIRHWFRTDAQMRRNYMSPEERELERQRIGERRRLAKEWRAAAEKDRKRREHRHGVCRECVGGYVDIGALTGEVIGDQTVEIRSGVCCGCLREQTFKSRPCGGLEWGPNRTSFRCRVLNPDSVEDEAEIAV